MGIIQNPILGGCYPDPSVCSVLHKNEAGQVTGADYYLVNSSFAYAPGVPIFHSSDMECWEQIGHVLDRKEQLRLDGAGMSQGIYAPTIRYHKGTFYVISTNVSGGGNFYVTAKKPEGPWSDPVYLPDAPGIDPSLYFENDTCYYIGQRTKENAGYFGDCEIWLQELDLEQKKLVGERYALWDGAMKRAIWPEGPHLYKRGGYYYLLIAEGGTEYSHSICVARSRELTGPYEACPNNPIFTHRHLGHCADIQNVGHGDMVETLSGNWYIALLATRPIEGCAPLGRETFLAEVAWEDDWPVINPGEGRVRVLQPVDAKAAEDGDSSANGKCTDLSGKRRMSGVCVKEDGRLQSDRDCCIAWSDPLDMRCLFFRYPQDGMYHIRQKGEENELMLRVGSGTLADEQPPSYIGIRVTDQDFSIKTKMYYEDKAAGEAGLAYLYDEKHHVKLVLCADENGRQQWRVKLCEGGAESVLGRRDADGMCQQAEQDSNVFAGAMHRQRAYVIELALSGLLLVCKVDERVVAEADVRGLTAERAGGFVGCTMGVYAGGNKEKADSYACFSKLLVGQ